MARPARQALNGMPIGIARGEIELREIRVSAEDSSTRLTLSKKSGHSKADISRMLVMMLRTVTFMAACCWCSRRTIIVRGGVLLRQPFIEPSQDGANVGIHIAQPLQQVGQRKRLRVGLVPKFLKQDLREEGMASRLCRAGCPPGYRLPAARRGCAQFVRRACADFPPAQYASVIATAHSSPIVSGCTR